MCQRRPGPRCSNHARARLNEARDAKTAADQAVEAFEAAPAPRPGEVTPEEYASWRETRLALQVEATKADKGYRTALRELEATPVGMQALEEAIAIVGEDSPEGREMAERLDDARALRSFQNGELRASRAYQERLTYLSAGERAALDQSEAAVDAARQRLMDAETSLVAATARSREFTEAGLAAAQVWQQAEAAMAAATAATEQAREGVRVQLVGLYAAAGVPERMAGFYATDTLVAATRPTGAPWRRNEGPELVMRRTPVLKTKPSGPDAERTLMARVASESNSEYALAVAQWHQAGDHLAAAREAVRTTSAPLARPNEDRVAARNALRVAQVEHQEATAGVTKAEDAHRDLHARIGSGLSTLPVTEVRMENAGDQFMRNPDGTTNTYVYQPPSDGFEHGRYVRVGGVTSAHGMGEVNALVLDTGEKAVLSGHYGRSGGGFARETRGGVSVAYTVPAQDGAVPLRSENRADRGFYAFVDSTD